MLLHHQNKDEPKSVIRMTLAFFLAFSDTILDYQSSSAFTPFPSLFSRWHFQSATVLLGLRFAMSSIL